MLTTYESTVKTKCPEMVNYDNNCCCKSIKMLCCFYSEMYEGQPTLHSMKMCKTCEITMFTVNIKTILPIVVFTIGSTKKQCYQNMKMTTKSSMVRMSRESSWKKKILSSIVSSRGIGSWEKWQRRPPGKHVTVHSKK